jgi:hypothetical protein
MPDSYRAKSALLAYAYALYGQDANAEKELSRTLAVHPDLDPYSFALIYTGRRKYDQALTQWESGYDPKTIYLVSLKIGEDWSSEKSTPIQSIIEKTEF